MLSPKEIVNKWMDAFNAGDVDMLASLYDTLSVQGDTEGNLPIESW